MESMKAEDGKIRVFQSRTRRATLSAGLGNLYSGFGVNGEYHFLAGRMSIVAGVGVLPDPTTVGFSAAVRGFTAGEKHRMFLELSVSPLATERTYLGNKPVDSKDYYGPGLSVGYNYSAARGFTFLVSGGAGWAAGLETVYGMGLLGFGYTWPHDR